MLRQGSGRSNKPGRTSRGEGVWFRGGRICRRADIGARGRPDEHIADRPQDLRSPVATHYGTQRGGGSGFAGAYLLSPVHVDIRINEHVYHFAAAQRYLDGHGVTAFNGLIVRRVVGLLIRCFLQVKGTPFVVQPDDNFDDNAYGHERTQSNPRVLQCTERRAAAALCERTRTHRKVFLHRVAQVRVLSGPPFFPRAKPIEFSDCGL
jgi:hypothetical protein